MYASGHSNEPSRTDERHSLPESDRKKLTARIDDAEASPLARAQELFHAGSKELCERQEVDAALYSLRALKSAAISAKAKKEMNFSSDDQTQAA